MEPLEVLRLGNPCFGSLAPSLDRPSKAEVSFDPLVRWNVLGERVPRGYKPSEHLEILRLGNPCFSSLAPSLDRPGVHEVHYDPLKRWTALSFAAKQPRGHKSVEHLEILRLGDPTYGTLAPRKRVSKVTTLEGLRSLPRNMSIESFVCDDEDEPAEIAELPSLAQRLAWRKELHEDDGYENESEPPPRARRSRARRTTRSSRSSPTSSTAARRASGRRCSSRARSAAARASGTSRSSTSTSPATRCRCRPPATSPSVRSSLREVPTA
jgi:hypothetical protein